MDRWHTLALGALLPVAAFAQVAPATSAAHILTRAELDALLAKPDELLIIDVRRPDEIGTVGGFAVYLNIQPGDVQSHLALIPRDRTIVTVSNRVTRSGRVADELAAAGFKVAGAIGARDYESAGGSLVRILPRTVAAAPAR